MGKGLVTKEQRVFISVLIVDELKVDDQVNITWERNQITVSRSGKEDIGFTCVVDLITFLNYEKLFDQARRRKILIDDYTNMKGFTKETRTREKDAFYSVLAVDELKVVEDANIEWGRDQLTVRRSGKEDVGFTSVVDLVTFLNTEKLFDQETYDGVLIYDNHENLIGINLSPMYDAMSTSIEGNKENND
ncbi:hypothetical protein MOD96_01325 [Bacillus sp. S17B2]|uniref:hypothetical protein n=1 Tax=Bacillus sp. S17B2 TaxID=2918907 RepID=UPI0022824FB4|nr:hypothetical protein [Bacillus sp. S17B2]